MNDHTHFPSSRGGGDHHPHGMGDVPRYARTEREDRTSLPGHLWWGIVHRDDFTCQWCHHISADHAGLQVDHITPYSAGGFDNSPNLRTLCVRCNQTRSNFETWEWCRPRAVVATCNGVAGESAADRVTVYCLAHRRVESLPDYYAQAHELAYTLGRPTPRRPADPITPHAGAFTLDLPELP